ncbi:MAG: hypothetical protein ACPG52_00765 [Cognaticolwellia sp.]
MNKLAHLYSVVICCLFTFYSHQSYSQQLDVGVEPFPPLINEDGSGFVVDMLNSLSRNSDLQFNFHVMTYARAKKDLQSQRLNLIGLTPFQLETQNFYQYANELNWGINTHVDFFSLHEKHFDIEQLSDGSIGTLTGNAEFFAEIINVPAAKFIEVSSLAQLVRMLSLGRLKVILFERASTITAIAALKIDNIYYKNMGVVPASLAVSNSPQGIKLKAQLDKLLLGVDNKKFFNDFIIYNNMPESGQIINNQN